MSHRFDPLPRVSEEIRRLWVLEIPSEEHPNPRPPQRGEHFITPDGKKVIKALDDFSAFHWIVVRASPASLPDGEAAGRLDEAERHALLQAAATISAGVEAALGQNEWLDPEKEPVHVNYCVSRARALLRRITAEPETQVLSMPSARPALAAKDKAPCRS